MSRSRCLLAVCACLVLFGAQGRAQWVPAKGPYNALVRNFVMSPGANGVMNLYVATRGGVFVTRDTGVTWNATSFTKDAPFVTMLPDGKGATMLCTADASVLSLSTDGGSTWSPTPAALTGKTVTCAAANDSMLFAGCESGVYRSADKGAHWVATNAGIDTALVYDIRVVAGNIFIATELGVYRSPDDGAQWIRCDPNAGIEVASSLESIDDGQGGTRVFVATYGGVFSSVDTGKSWTKSPLSGGWSDIMAARNSNGGTIMLASWYGAIFVSSDVGKSWRKTPYFQSSVECTAIAAMPRSDGGYKLFAGTDCTGIFLAESDGDRWIRRSTGLTNSMIEVLAGGPIDGAKTMLVTVPTRCGAYRSADCGASWQALNTYLSWNGRTVFAVSDSVLVAATDKGMFRSWDRGNGFITTGRAADFKAVRTLAILPDSAGGSMLFAADRKLGLFRSRDKASNWTPCNTGLDNYDVSAIISRNTGAGARIFLGVQTGSGNGVYISTDNGSTWSPRNDGLNSTAVQSMAIGSDRQGASHLYAGTDDGIYHSSDDGMKWDRVLAGTWTHQSFAVFHQNVFFGNDSGVFLSSDNGTVWTTANDGLSDRNVVSLVTGNDSSGVAFLFAGTARSGVWKRPLSEIVNSVAQRDGALERVLALEQNHPNPARAATEIPFTLFRAGHVTLRVYDALGRNVSTPLNQELPAGAHSAAWDATALPAGVYRYCLEVRGRRETKTMVVVR